jgi:hypothetical protein
MDGASGASLNHIPGIADSLKGALPRGNSLAIWETFSPKPKAFFPQFAGSRDAKVVGGQLGRYVISSMLGELSRNFDVMCLP